MAKKPLSAFRQAVGQTAKNAIAHGVGKSAAAQAYYFLFALFPLLIFISNLLGLLRLDTAALVNAAQAIVPKSVLELFTAYLEHVSETSSKAVLWFSLGFTVWFPLRAIRGLTGDVRKAYQLGRPHDPLRHALRQLVLTVAFLLFILVVLLLSILGRRTLAFFLRLFPALTHLAGSAFLLRLWQYLRFVLAAAVMFLAVCVLYLSAQDGRKALSELFPGVALAITGWLVVSIGFSFYVENLGRYSLLYGALGAVVVLLTWLYLSAWMLLLGAEFNAALSACSEDASH